MGLDGTSATEEDEMLRYVPALILATIAMLAPTSAAGAGGFRVDYLDTSETGIDDPSSEAHFYALPYGQSTAVMKVRAAPDPLGRTLEVHHLHGYWRIASVATDGSTSGIAADGSTLVLVGQGGSGPKFTLVETERLTRTETIVLDGDFTLDAVSPDGGMLYLVHYLDPRDPLLYEVVAYDVERGELLPEPIIDRRLAPEVMSGLPLTRENSAGGAWAYTLYEGGHHAEPFVHALDTENARALCIDLPMLTGMRTRDLNDLTLEPSEDGEAIAVLGGDGAALATIETGTWEVTEGAPQPAEAEAAGAGSLPFVAAGGVVLVVLLLVGGATRRSAR
jgi:hypothetical protein